MTNERIGAFIAAMRKEQKLTQEQLAEKLGISNRSVSRWENGKTMPDLSMMEELCKVLEISLPELLRGEKEASDLDTEEIVTLMATMAQQEQEQKAREMNRCLIPGVLLAAAAIISGNLPAGIAGVGLLVLGIFRNSRSRTMTDRELRLLSQREEILRMTTAAEMIRFARKHQKPELSQHRKAFEAIEKALEKEEYGVFSMTGSGYQFNGNPGPWHIALVLSNKRLLLCGESVRGRLMTHYMPEWLERSEICAISLSGRKIVIQADQDTVTVEGEDLSTMAEKLKKALQI